MLVLLVAIVIATAGCASATSSSTVSSRAHSGPDFRLTQVRGLTFDGPVWAGSAPGSGSTYYVVEQRGIVWAVTGTRKQRFLDLRPRVLHSGEQGLLSLAFATDYATSGRLFVYYVARDGSGHIDQLRARTGRIVAGSTRRVIRVPLAPPNATNHNGGNLWARTGGQLLLSIGDGGGGGVELRNSQRMTGLMGKLIRIVPKPNGGYTIPRDNPFVHQRGARHEIYALGLRNPWRFSVDEPTGDIWIGDVGQSTREEINRMPGGRPAGANFGWPRMEGNHVFASSERLAAGTRYARPFLDYGRGDGQCSITGGVVYRGPVKAMRGRYLYADYCTDRIWSVRAGSKRPIEHDGAPGIVHFGAISGGNVLAVSTKTGHLYRIAAA